MELGGGGGGGGMISPAKISHVYGMTADLSAWVPKQVSKNKFHRMKLVKIGVKNWLQQ